MGVVERAVEGFKHGWNAFRALDPAARRGNPGPEYGYAGGGARQDRIRMMYSNERSMVASIYVRIAIDAASVAIEHARLDENDQFLETIDSPLNYCLTQEANIDQGASMFRQDLVQTLLDRGIIAVVPVDTQGVDPLQGGGFDVVTMRVGEVVSWYPQHVRVRLYNEKTGLKEELVLPKKIVAIIENPLYSIMNEPNSTMQRLTRKLNLLDQVDEVAASGKLDIIIQMPGSIRSETRKKHAETRRADMEAQLSGSKYGVAYTDGTERITQLNRPVENNMLAQVQYLTEQAYGQMGITPEVMLGTADEATMINYYNRTIEPILRAIKEEMARKFLTKTARTQKQALVYFRDPFKLVPLTVLAEITDKFTRNEVLSSNEVRGAIGFRPSKDPKANELRNSNVPQAAEQEALEAAPADDGGDVEGILDDVLNQLEAQVDSILGEDPEDDPDA